MNQQIVVIANGAPYGSESLFNALRPLSPSTSRVVPV